MGVHRKVELLERRLDQPSQCELADRLTLIWPDDVGPRVLLRVCEAVAALRLRTSVEEELA